MCVSVHICNHQFTYRPTVSEVIQNGIISPTAFEESCKFEPLELYLNCFIDMDGKNMDLEASTVSGILTLNNGQDIANSSCKQTKEVIIYNSEPTEMFANSFINCCIKIFIIIILHVSAVSI